MNLDDYSKENLWRLLVELVQVSVMYPTHKAYTRDIVLPEVPDITPKELAQRLNMPLGEALVIIDELVGKQINKT
ncbi:MAG: hypothetical protein FWH37_03220 [Candidatus Bathyarchaeota archaeon]|nr:hypothetical protein [Candidatus Termiticorpusculum sp.]